MTDCKDKQTAQTENVPTKGREEKKDPLLLPKKIEWMRTKNSVCLCSQLRKESRKCICTFQSNKLIKKERIRTSGKMQVTEVRQVELTRTISKMMPEQ